MIKAVLCIWFVNRYLEGSDIIHTLKVLNKHYALWKLEFSHPQEKINKIDIETTPWERTAVFASLIFIDIDAIYMLLWYSNSVQ